MSNPPVNRGPLPEIAAGFWAPRVLHVAVKLEVFTRLSGRPLDLEGAARALGIQLRPAGRLLNACVALGLLEKEEGIYRNSALAEEFLVQGKPSYYGHFVSSMEALYREWVELEQAVRENGPVHRTRERWDEDREFARAFTLAMRDKSVGSGRLLAEHLGERLARARRLIDVAGGSGMVAVELAEFSPSLEAVVFDLPLVCEAAQEVIAGSPAASRVKVHPGDLRQGLPRGFDLAILSSILHALGVETCRALVRETFECLNPGGCIAILECLLNQEKSGPPYPALFALNMLLMTEEGDVYTGGEIRGWLEEAGFREIAERPFAGPVSLVTGVK
ncbi:MAG: methyltransferase domain-containing protein [Candidatus Tectomicrobia bacterium]|uniref:Methyltransferase domain-containing protein n=1 Tax=Tectimicrobiota bacterium TaxID=2528274 RepID=A0A932CNG9_UNCTE|nr:methyltransferase domain-containing protein [Candidatus Tectomicrobia bacterium]